MKIPTKLIRTEWPPMLTPGSGNTHFDEVFASIKQEGILNPLTINLNWFVLNGNHRLAAARLLGITEVEVEVWTGSEFVR
jgi:ParB-like chromosome segregation protein Spo0J